MFLSLWLMKEAILFKYKIWFRYFIMFYFPQIKTLDFPTYYSDGLQDKTGQHHIRASEIEWWMKTSWLI